MQNWDSDFDSQSGMFWSPTNLNIQSNGGIWDRVLNIFQPISYKGIQAVDVMFICLSEISFHCQSVTPLISQSDSQSLPYLGKWWDLNFDYYSWMSISGWQQELDHGISFVADKNSQFDKPSPDIHSSHLESKRKGRYEMMKLK